MLQCLEDLYDSFTHLMGDMLTHIKLQFATFKEPPFFVILLCLMQSCG